MQCACKQGAGAGSIVIIVLANQKHFCAVKRAILNLLFVLWNTLAYSNIHKEVMSLPLRSTLKFPLSWEDSSGLYYKHISIVNDDSSVVIKWSFKLIDATRGIIYDRHMFVVRATDLTRRQTF